jgi:predicted RND superfamily exporter protein
MKSRQWLWLLLVVPAAFGLARLRFDVEVLNLLPGELPVVRGLKLYQQNFSSSRELIITLRGPDAEQVEKGARAIATGLRQQPGLVESVMWQPGWLERPVLAAELIGYLWFNQPPETFGQLTNRLMGQNRAATLAEAREQLATSMSPMDLARRGYDPFNLMQLPENVSAAGASFGDGQNLFSSKDGTFRIVFVQAKEDLKNYRACLAWLDAIKKSIERLRGQEISPDIVFGFTGSPAFVAEISGGMEHDMTESIGLTSVIIAILFWIAHRRIVPMLWLLTLLALILGATLAFGALIFGAINVVSLGFAAILLGLAVDYGVVHYQEALANPNAIIPEIRRAIGPSIFWAAVTTISAFLVLNFGGLPGLAQLGSLVALGVALAALVMLFAFLPPLFRDRLKKRREHIAAGQIVSLRHVPDLSLPPRQKIGVVISTVFIIVVAALILGTGLPHMDHTANALRPQNSQAYNTLDEMKRHLVSAHEPLWVIVEEKSEEKIARQLDKAAVILQNAFQRHEIASFNLPTTLWPRMEFQSANRSIASGIAAEKNNLRSAALAAGFTTNSVVMTDAILQTFDRAATGPVPFWPTNELSRWVLEKMVARPGGAFLAVGFVIPTSEPSGKSAADGWAAELSRTGFVVSGWELLGSAIFQRVKENLWRLVVPMVALVLLSLWLAFRGPTEILLSIAVLCLSGLCLLTTMRLAGWSWNLLNLMALPLMLGSGVDYSIFMQLALRRHDGDLRAAYRSVGRALLLCGGTAVAGFGSLSLSTNAGMASLGKICAIGIGCNMLFSVYLLPVWWRLAVRRS